MGVRLDENVKRKEYLKGEKWKEKVDQDKEEDKAGDTS